MRYVFAILTILLFVSVALIWQAGYVVDLVENGIGYVPKSWNVIWWSVFKIVAIGLVFSAVMQSIVKAIIDD